MKKILINLGTWCCFLPFAQGQPSFGLRLGTSPSVNPATPSLLTERGSINESQFDIQEVDFSNQIGLLVRLKYNQFWFMGEALYGQSTTHYSINYTYRNSESANYKLKKSFLDMPITAGVKLGIIEIFSGFFVSKDLEMENELTQMSEYSFTSPSWQLGWHSGVGLNIGMILMDVRYQQEFNNYGTGQYIGDQELILKNVPARMTVTLGVHLK